MPSSLTRRRYRLIALDAEALSSASAVELLPPLERLLRAGVTVLALDGRGALELAGASTSAAPLRDGIPTPSNGSRSRPPVTPLRSSIRGPHKRGLVVHDPGGDALALDASGGASRAQPLARWVKDALAAPRGIRPADVVLVGPPRALARGLSDASFAVVRLEDPRALPALLSAQAALHPVALPGWIESDPAWHLVEQGYVAEREHELESIFAIGNGYVGSRASLAEGGPLSSPATFVAGVYHLPGPREVPELLRLPDWARLRGTVDGDVLRIDEGDILSHRRILDLRDGVLWREWRHTDPVGRVSTVRGLRVASFADRHVLLQSVTLTPENYGGHLCVESVLSGTRVSHASSGATVALSIRSHIETPHAFLRRDDMGHAVRASERTVETLELDVALGDTVRLDRVAVLHTSRDHARPIESSAQHLERALDERGVEGLLADHRRAWRAVWEGADVHIDGDAQDQQSLRFAIYHLLSAVHPDDEAVSVGARGLTGGSYKGHVFWDTEIYMLPFYALSRPRAARSVLMYRYNTLEPARARAREMGATGALYAWESADTGEDVTPSSILAPTGEILPVYAGTQEQHISADVAYGVWQYWHASGDDAFLREAGAEILIETARFWASRAEEGEDGLLHLRGVMGPDEYHPSVDDNAYTNGMAAWNLEQAAEAVALSQARWPDALAALSERLELEPGEVSAWREIAGRLFTGFDPETGLFEQFRGYFELEPIDLAEYEPRTLPIDLVLGHERVRASQIVKQPDVLMLLWLLRDRFPRAVLEANFRYYDPRTAHGSSLSPPIHAALAARLGDSALALRYFRQTAEIDLANNMGNAAGGVHMAALGGLWQAAVLGIGGLSLSDPPSLDPRLPAEWRAIRFGVEWRGDRVEVSS